MTATTTPLSDEQAAQVEQILSLFGMYPGDFYLLRQMVVGGQRIIDTRRGFQRWVATHPHYKLPLDADRIRRLVELGALTPHYPEGRLSHRVEAVTFTITPLGRLAVAVEQREREQASQARRGQSEESL